MNRAHMPPVRRWVGELLLGTSIFGAVACSSGAEMSAGFTVRDSAGVAIVETAEPAWHEGSRWHVSPEPLLEIGVRDGDPAHQFTRVTTALRLPDGDIVVGDLQTAEIRRFDRHGGHVWTAGGRGGGPGEFSGIRRVWYVPSDTIVVFDPWGSRISYLDSKGRFFRAVRIRFEATSSSMRYTFRARFPDGTFLARLNRQYTRELAVGSGLVRDTVAWLRMSATGEVIDTIGHFLGYEGYGYESDGEPGVAMHIFGPGGPVTVTQQRMYVGDGDRFEIDVYDFEGHLRRRIRRIGFVPPEITPAHVEEHKRRALENVSDERRRPEIERRYRALPQRRYFPAFREMLLDKDGNLWVEVFPIPGDTLPVWSVFDSEGRLLGEVEMPPGLRIFEIGPDYVLGAWQDELDVPHVRMYELIKP